MSTERELTVPAADGYPLAATLYGPAAGRGSKEDTAPRGPTAVVLSSVGGDRRRYAPFAHHLADRGWSVLTFDYRGIGGSRRRPVRGFPASLSDWGARDVEGVLAWAAGRSTRHRRLVVVGHSVGGQILPLAPSHRRLDAILLVAPQAGWWRLRRGIWAHLVRGYFRLTPAVVAALGCLPLWPTGPERLPAGVALEWRRWCLEPAYRDLAGEALACRFAEVTAPVLAYSFTDDPLFSPRPAAEALLALYANAPVVHRHLAPDDLRRRGGAQVDRIGHRGFFDPAVGGALWAEAVAFLEGEEAMAQPAAGGAVSRAGDRRPDRLADQAPTATPISPRSESAAPGSSPSGR